MFVWFTFFFQVFLCVSGSVGIEPKALCNPTTELNPAVCLLVFLDLVLALENLLYFQHQMIHVKVGARLLLVEPTWSFGPR